MYDLYKYQQLITINEKHIGEINENIRIISMIHYSKKLIDNYKKLYTLECERMEVNIKKILECILKIERNENKIIEYYKRNKNEIVKYYYDIIERFKEEHKRGVYIKSLVLCGDHMYDERNYKEMKRYYDQAILLGDVEAMYKYARYYKYIKEDKKKAKHYLLKAINKGHLGAIYEMGRYNYLNDNYVEMKRYYKKSVKMGHLLSMYELGKYYYYVEKKNIKTKKYFKKCEQLGYVDIMYKMGSIYESEKKYEKMKRYYMMLIKSDNTESMIKMGNYYKNIEKNYDEMKKYYKMAVNLEDCNAMCNLGHYYENIEKNIDESTKYYDMAVRMKCSVAMSDMGLRYLKQEKGKKMKFYFYTAFETRNIRSLIYMGNYYLKKNDYYNYNLYFSRALEIDYNKALFYATSDNYKIDHKECNNYMISIKDMGENNYLEYTAIPINVYGIKYIIGKAITSKYNIERKYYDILDKSEKSLKMHKSLIKMRYKCKLDEIYKKYEKIMLLLLISKGVPKYIKIKIVINILDN